MVEKFIQIAITQIGYKEGKNNDTKYGTWFGMPNQPWCFMFVDWCANQAGILGTLIPRTASCPTGYKWFKDKGLITSTPKRGYLGFVTKKKSNGTINAEHVFIVEKVNNNGTITTIEGNLSDKVCRNTRKVTSSLKFAKVEVKDEWTTGVYKLLKEKALRKTHSLVNSIYKVKDCNKTIQKYLNSTKANADAYLTTKEDVRIVDIYKQGNRVWGKLNFKDKQYWLVLCNADGTKQAKRI